MGIHLPFLPPLCLTFYFKDWQDERENIFWSGYIVNKDAPCKRGEVGPTDRFSKRLRSFQDKVVNLIMEDMSPWLAIANKVNISLSVLVLFYQCMKKYCFKGAIISLETALDCCHILKGISVLWEEGLFASLCFQSPERAHSQLKLYHSTHQINERTPNAELLQYPMNFFSGHCRLFTMRKI